MISLTKIKYNLWYLFTSPWQTARFIYYSLKNHEYFFSKDKVNIWKEFFLWRMNKQQYTEEIEILAAHASFIKLVSLESLNFNDITATNWLLIKQRKLVQLTQIELHIINLNKQQFYFFPEKQAILLEEYNALAIKIKTIEIPLLNEKENTADTSVVLQAAEHNMELEALEHRIQQERESHITELEKQIAKNTQLNQDLTEKIEEINAFSAKLHETEKKLTHITSDSNTSKIIYETKQKEYATLAEKANMQEVTIQEKNKEIQELTLSITAEQKKHRVTKEKLMDLEHKLSEKTESYQNEIIQNNLLTKEKEELSITLARDSKKAANLYTKQQQQLNQEKKKLNDKINENIALDKQLQDLKLQKEQLNIKYNQLLDLTVAATNNKGPLLVDANFALNKAMSNIKPVIESTHQVAYKMTLTTQQIFDESNNLMLLQKNQLSITQKYEEKLKELTALKKNKEFMQNNSHKSDTQKSLELAELEYVIQEEVNSLITVKQTLDQAVQKVDKKSEDIHALQTQISILKQDLELKVKETRSCLLKATTALDDYSKIILKEKTLEKHQEIEDLIKQEQTSAANLRRLRIEQELKKPVTITNNYKKKEQTMPENTTVSVKKRNLTHQIQKDLPDKSTINADFLTTKPTTVEEVD